MRGDTAKTKLVDIAREEPLVDAAEAAEILASAERFMQLPSTNKDDGILLAVIHRLARTVIAKEKEH